MRKRLRWQVLFLSHLPAGSRIVDQGALPARCRRRGLSQTRSGMGMPDLACPQGQVSWQTWGSASLGKATLGTLGIRRIRGCREPGMMPDLAGMPGMPEILVAGCQPALELLQGCLRLRLAGVKRGVTARKAMADTQAGGDFPWPGAGAGRPAPCTRLLEKT